MLLAEKITNLINHLDPLTFALDLMNLLFIQLHKILKGMIKKYIHDG